MKISYIVIYHGLLSFDLKFCKIERRDFFIFVLYRVFRLSEVQSKDFCNIIKFVSMSNTFIAKSKRLSPAFMFTLNTTFIPLESVQSFQKMTFKSFESFYLLNLYLYCICMYVLICIYI